MNKISQLFNKYREIIMYIFIGGCTTLVDWVVYSLLMTFTDVGMTAANGAAWFVSVVFAFVTNKLFVFESRSTEKKVLIREILAFFGARVFSGAIGIILPTVLFDMGLDMSLFGIEGFAAKAAVSVLIVIMNYVLSKLLVFRKNK